MSVVQRLFYVILGFSFIVSVCCGFKKHEDKVIFPETHDEIRETPPVAEEIPIEVMRRLSEVTNISDLIENFIDMNGNSSSLMDELEPFGIGSRMGGPLERNAILTPIQAACAPELTTVPIAENKNTATLYFPQCIRVKRCGGCCGHDLLSCQPEETQILNYAVFTAEYSGRGKFTNLKREVVQMEEHTACKCNCKIKQQDCSRYQIYNPTTCSCECDNNDEKEKCNKQGNLKLWDPNNCRCMCRELQECGSGSYFSPYTCTCRKAPKHSNTRWVVD